MFIYIKISNNLQFLALATVYGHLATVYYLLQKRAPTVNQIVQNGCLQFISFLGHYFTPAPMLILILILLPALEISTYTYTYIYLYSL